MKKFNIKKFFLKKENSFLLENIAAISFEPFSVIDNEGNTIAGAHPVKDLVSFPVKINEEEVGRVFGKRGAEAAAILSRSINSWLVKRSLADELLQKYKEQDLLYNINDLISLCPKPKEAADFIISELSRLIKFEYASIIIFNDFKKKLNILSEFGKNYNSASYKKNIEKINAKVFKSGKGEIINENIEKDWSGRKKVKINAKSDFYSFMSVPLRTKGKNIGLINVCSFNEAAYYISSDFKILSTIASYAANSIEITRLYNIEKERADNLQKKNKELNAAKEVIFNENINLKQNLRHKFSPKKILGTSKQVQNLLDKIGKIAGISSNILITGESGTGKELAAKAVHYSGARAEKPFVAVNCSAIPESIFESELFGIEKGVATGVDKRKGKVLEADKGTLFLDEIGDMPLPGQAKVLRMIQDREVVPVGGTKPVPFDARIIAATNKDLKKEIEAGNFRGDLFYRLNVININIPPLRDRKEDILVLANYFLKNNAVKLERRTMQFSKDAIKALINYDWPGNIRELENEIERAVALSISDEIYLEDLSENIRQNSMPDNNALKPVKIKTIEKADNEQKTATIDENEADLIKKALEEARWNKSAAAKTLGISREGLRKKIIRLGIQT
ncbi:MAG: sigma-54-dependent Fis family transcriptional regulator [Deltaproteobacteria bacterium]|nr:sigma-54-dependent Fis family transcriptional regulator [Deltaproteobacteria bacterium]